MLRHFAIVNTDLVNRQNLRIPASALVSVLEQTQDAGTPMLISHDVHRPLGWTKTIGVQVDPHRVALVAQMSFAETEAEGQLTRRKTQAYFLRQHSRITPDQTQALQAALGSSLSENAEFLFREAACVLDGGIVLICAEK